MTVSARAASAVRSMEGFTSCGDATFVGTPGTRQIYALVDALGHGPDAEKSAKRACEVLASLPDASLGAVFSACDQALHGMRGAVIGAIQLTADRVMFAGVGNVELVGPSGVSRPCSVPGYLGQGRHRFREQELPVTPGARWALASDGIRFRGLQQALESTLHLELEAAAKELFSRNARSDDDASLLLVEFGAGP